MAIDIGSSRRNQELHHRRLLVGLRPALQRNPAGDSLMGLGRDFLHHVGHAGFGQPRANRIDPDAFPAELARQALDQPDQPMLGRAIGPVLAVTAQPHGRGGHNDSRILSPPQQRQAGADTEDRPDQVDIHHPAQKVGGHVVNRAAANDPGIEDRRIEPAEQLVRFSRDPRVVFLGRNIRHKGRDARALGPCQLIGVEIDGQHQPPAPRQPLRRSPAHAAGGSGDYYRF